VFSLPLSLQSFEGCFPPQNISSRHFLLFFVALLTTDNARISLPILRINAEPRAHKRKEKKRYIPTALSSSPTPSVHQQESASYSSGFHIITAVFFFLLLLSNLTLKKESNNSGSVSYILPVSTSLFTSSLTTSNK
jgi:hypothetical protein